MLCRGVNAEACAILDPRSMDERPTIDWQSITPWRLGSWCHFRSRRIDDTNYTPVRLVLYMRKRLSLLCRLLDVALHRVAQ